MDSSLPSDELRYLRLRDSLRAVFVLFMALGVAVLLNLWSKEQIRPRNPQGATLSSLRGIVGWPDKIDVVASLAAARSHSRIRELRGITVDGVQSDGTVNLKTGERSSKFVFQGPPQPRPPSTGVAKGEKGTDRAGKEQGPTGPICSKQTVKLTRKGLRLEDDRADARCPTDLAEPLGPPQCGPKELWARALKKGAKKDALARMDYFRSNAGPAWKFVLPHHRFQFYVTGDCKRELLAGEATGKVY